MLSRLAVCLALALLAMAARADGTTLTPGAAAPPMAVSHWLKGAPVDTLELGKIYVVEFWATRCGPCYESIPHITTLAKANPDVTFVGVGIWEDWDPNALPKFVTKLGDKMDYHVGYSSNKAGMAASWMDASSQNGIPTAFVVKDRIVMWVGHPDSLDKPLAEIKAGTFDLAAHRVTFDKHVERNRRMNAAFSAISAAEKRFDSGDRAGAKAELDKADIDYPEQKVFIDRTRFNWLSIEDPKAWIKKAREMAAGDKEPDLQTLRSFALYNATNPKRAAMAKKALAVLLEAKPADFQNLLYAYNFYKQSKDERAELKTIDQLLALGASGSRDVNAEFTVNLTTRKKELQTRLH